MFCRNKQLAEESGLFGYFCSFVCFTCNLSWKTELVNVGIFHLSQFSGAFIVFKASSSEV